MSRVLLAAADTFWDHANLAERCVGRISAKGIAEVVSVLVLYVG